MAVTDMSICATTTDPDLTTDESIASIIPLRKPKTAKTAAERARAYRNRKRQKGSAASPFRVPERQTNGVGRLWSISLGTRHDSMR